MCPFQMVDLTRYSAIPVSALPAAACLKSQFTDSEAGHTLRRLSPTSCPPGFRDCLTRDFLRDCLTRDFLDPD